jgi:hypothetical protein
MKLTKLLSWRFVTPESGMSALLIFALAYLFVVCTFGDLSFGGLVGRVLFSLVIIAGVTATFRQRWVRSFVIVLAGVGFSLTWLEHIHHGLSLRILNAVIGMIFLLFLFSTLIVQVFRAGPVTTHRIRGAIVVYLFMGGIWSFFYYVTALTIPHAFNLPEGLAVGDQQQVQQILTYFSFTTLTTTGFGDVTPAIFLTRSLAMFESLAGQLYLCVTLTRLVSLSVIYPKTPDKPD